MADRVGGNAPPRQVVIGEGRHAVTYELVDDPHPIDTGRGAGDAESGHEARRQRRLVRYRQPDSRAMAVATGRVFVRMATEATVDQLERALSGTPLAVRQRVSYAPNAAWVAAISGDPAEALRAIARLAALPGVAHVEPELQRERASR